MDTVPLIDVRALVDPTSSPQARREVAARMGAACRNTGFFYVVGHGVDVGLQARLEALARDFFAQAHHQAVGQLQLPGVLFVDRAGLRAVLPAVHLHGRHRRVR
ncbi:2-oxoglutarate and iron-dependent oxygenase domain-containing protein, partial [Corallococcus exiguus]|uniref:2-oxoglutarate and iron-dependent oxygenase domain-containing protein n=1 Tax=Corallococcus exiguus TaxID=83462 RepID=UPI0020A62D03